jgi:carnitine 3-dehydrogenase
MEAMYLHVHMESGKVCTAEADAAGILTRIASAHEKLPKPEAVGRAVGQR